MKLLNILDEKEKVLHQVSKDITFPLSTKDKDLIKDMIDYLTKSQIDKYIEEFCLRPGMGLAFVQLGILKRIAVVVLEVDDEQFENYILINPKIISASEELIYAGEGEGCLSVQEDQPGFVMRHARITIETYDLDGNKYTFRAREALAIAIQHELDHMDGILYYERINKQNPFMIPEGAREI